MQIIKNVLAVLILMAGVNFASAQCNAYFNYTYHPELSQPEQSIYFFTDSSTGQDSSTTYEWSFGTGDFSSLQNPAFTYEAGDSGIEQVCLTIHNADNNCTSQYCRNLHVDDLCIAARFNCDLQGFTGTFKADICGTWDSIHWDFGDGTQATQGDSIVHTYPAVADSYYVCVEVMLSSECQNLYPCKAIYCQQVYVYPTGIEPMQVSGSAIKIYPNPTGSYLHVSASSALFPAEVRVTDITGKLVICTRLESPNSPINVSDVDAGIYLLSISDDTGPAHTGRFIKQ